MFLYIYVRETMAFWHSNNNKTLRAKILGLRKGDPSLHFEIKKGDEVMTAEFIEGRVKKIELDSYEYEGRKRETFKITIHDEGEEIVLGTAWTAIGRNIINTLANDDVDFSKKIKFSLYRKERDDGKIFNQIGLRQGDTMLKWKHDWDKQKSLMEEVKDPKTKEFLRMDYSELEKLLKEDVEAINKRLAKTDFPIESAVSFDDVSVDEDTYANKTEDSTSKSTEKNVWQEDDDDLPF